MSHDFKELKITDLRKQPALLAAYTIEEIAAAKAEGQVVFQQVRTTPSSCSVKESSILMLNTIALSFLE